MLKAHESPSGTVVDALSCESDFLKLHANGTSEAAAASLTFSLKQLSDQLGQFVDLGAVQLAGDGYGSLNWKRSPPPGFAADAEIHVSNIQLAMPNRSPWRKDGLVISASAKGQTDLGANTRIDTAGLNLTMGTDQLAAQLAEPVQDLSNGGTWAIGVKLQGQLQSWPGRLALWLPNIDWHPVGGYWIDVQATASKDRFDLRGARITARRW